MGEMTAIGLDLAKNFFQVHGIAADGTVVVRRHLRRGEVLKFFRSVPACPVASRTGTSSSKAVLTEAEVPAIRASQESQRKLAQLYGVSRSLVEQIKSGKVWKHLLPAAAQGAPSGNRDEGSV